MDYYNIIAQIFGLIAMYFSIFSFQKNTHKSIMKMQFFAATFFTVNYYMLGLMPAAMINLISMVRDVIYYFKEDKKWAASPIWSYLFYVIYIIGGFFTFDGSLWSVVPIVSILLNNLTFSFTNPKLVRITILASSPLNLIYGIHGFAIGSIINESFVIVSSIIGIFRYDLKSKKN